MIRVPATAQPDPAPPASAVRQWSIRSQILALVLAVALPLIVVIGYLIHERWQHGIVDAEETANPKDLKRITGLDFSFHHLMGMASGNLIYPLLINSFKPVYMNFTTLFFSDADMVPATIVFHRRLVKAIEDKDSDRAGSIMHETLAHGEHHLRRILTQAVKEVRQ